MWTGRTGRVGNGLGLGGIELGRLVEVVGVGFLGDLVCLSTVGPHVEFGLRRSPGGGDQRGRSGLSDPVAVAFGTNVVFILIG